VENVKRAVTELLHFDNKHFKQIAMIAQGEFWNLLNAKTEQRTFILRTIFMTEGYKKLELKLTSKKRDKSLLHPQMKHLLQKQLLELMQEK